MRTVLLAVFSILTLGAGVCFGYEFSLLNGMKMKGNLKTFTDGKFYVETEFGPVVIEADKLDYIIVEATDPGPLGTGKDAAGAPGLGLGQKSEEDGRIKVAMAGDGPVSAPSPLADRSIGPAPLSSWSIDGNAYPGLFRGTE